MKAYLTYALIICTSFAGNMNQELLSSSFNEIPDSAFTHLLNLELNYSMKDLSKKFSLTENSDGSISDDDKNEKKEVSNHVTEKKNNVVKAEITKKANNQVERNLTTEAKVTATATICMPFNIVKTK